MRVCFGPGEPLGNARISIARKGTSDMQTDVGPPTDRPPAARPVTRRTALQFLGLGVGVVAVAGATGLILSFLAGVMVEHDLLHGRIERRRSTRSS